MNILIKMKAKQLDPAKVCWDKLSTVKILTTGSNGEKQ